ncbi:MAG TPA: ATP-binding cassette domain-containing protein [Sedimenticola sp.]|nr:ATP-binding cassette domain-containing protein [Sedimenticola sp.]
MLKLSNLSLRRGAKLLFRDADLCIHPGQRVGLTGANGAGKSSLFALIRGELHADAGDFHLPPKWVIAHVAQETPATDRPAIEYVMDGDRELREIQRKLAAAGQDPQGRHVAELHARLEAIGGYNARSRAARLLRGLGFQPGQEEMPVRTFSGGWRMRLNLGQALMCRSDLLLLDEPTNHLDLDTVIWLEAWLRNYPGALLLISHDRDFLDAVTTHIAHIEQQGIRLYPGNYSAFEVIRAQRLANQQAVYEKQQRDIAHLHRYIDRFRAKATKARQAQSRIKALERMEKIAPAHADSPFHFDFPPPEKSPNPLLRLEKIRAGYGRASILNGVDLDLGPGDRIGLLGPNGAGKSTLIKLLSGELPPQAGRYSPAADLRIGYFAQHQLEQLCPDKSPLDHLQRLDPGASEQSLRDFIGGFGFHGDRALEPTAPLSGGEKARLVLALLVFRRPNLLLLDEPTNHLDLEMRHALAVALQGFEGALLIVSHDRHLLRATADRLLLVADGRVEEFPGALDDYPRWLAENRAAGGSKTAAAAGDNSAAARRDRKQREAEQRRRIQPLRNRLRELEQELERLGEQQAALEQRLAAPDIYAQTRKEDLRRLLQEKAEADRRLARAEEAWLAAGEALEAAGEAS